jgi:hypothetical protein
MRNPRRFGNALPTDGYVRSLRGNFFPNAFPSQQGTIMVPMTWNNGNAQYEYWTTPEPVPDSLSQREREQLLKLPKISVRVREWVAEQIRGKTGESAVAVTLTRYLRENFTYELGAPDLNRLNPIEDFLFEQRNGHCERFASALAVALRIAGIPARVAVGYFPTRKNPFADFFNVSARDGHAWTEAFIEGKGWIILDATPYLAQNQVRGPSFVMSLFDWIEYVWYSKIVNYSRTDQTDILSGTLGIIQEIVTTCLQRPWIPGFLLLIAICAWIRRLPTNLFSFGRPGHRHPTDPEQQIREVQHFYHEMATLLARSGIARKPSQTPLEFLHELETQKIPCISEIQGITRIFCTVKYGKAELTEGLRLETRRMLETISHGNT